MPVNNNFLKQYPIKITRLAPSNNLLVIILGALAALTGSVNNQEATVTKNPMEQVRLEFQKLRAKNNLSASSAIEQTTITEYNCPTLYQTVATAFNSNIKFQFSSKLLMPTIYVTQYLKSTPGGLASNRNFLKYDTYKHILTIDQTLLEALTLSEFKLLLEHEINFAEIDAKYHLNNQRSGWKSFLKGFALGLAAPILAILILPAILALKLSTKQTIQWIPVGTAVIFSCLLVPTWFFTCLTCGHRSVLFALVCTQFAAVFLAVEIIICAIAYYHYKTKTAAKFSEVKQIPHCPNPELVAVILDKLKQNCAEHKTAKFDNWLSKRQEHLEFVSYGYQKQQEQIAVIQAIEDQDELVDNDSKSTGLEQSALAPA